ncbi:MAG: CHAD domain-containing protein [Roseibium sp.]|nr:CHAD domain-containing protein [Roseibium sp.]
MQKSAKEIELKLDVDPDALAELKRAGCPDGFTSSRAVTKTLHSTYFDTPERTLQRAKTSLRLRKVGRAWVQTVKIGTGVSGGLSSPLEVEHGVRTNTLDLDAIPDRQVAARLNAMLGSSEIGPCFETAIRRTTRVLTDQSDGSEIEVAFDTGEIRAGPTVVPVSELELELKSGSASALFKAARGLTGPAPFRFSPLSKAEQGYSAADNKPTGRAAPKTAEKVILDPDETVERAYRAVLRSCLDQISQNRIAVLSGDDPEGLHQLRVGLRRLRSALRLFKPVIHPTSHGPLDTLARALAADAGEVRDLDVLAEEIVQPLQEIVPDGVSMTPLVDHLHGVRDQARTALKHRLAKADVNGFLFDLSAYTEGRGWLDPGNFDQTARLAEPVSRFARSGLDRQWKAVSKFGRRIDDLTIPERHDMRKALKKLRYGMEFFGSLYPQETLKPFLKRMRRLQDIFGYLNDVAMAEKLVHLNTPGGRGAERRAQAVGFAIGWHEAQSSAMWQHAKGYWRDTKQVPKFWRQKK